MAGEVSQANVLRLYTLWVEFLNHAGKYTKRYYLARDLELAPGAQSPKSQQILRQYYDGDKEVLDIVIDRDLEKLPQRLMAISAAQSSCGLKGFSTNPNYLSQVIMGFTIHERHSEERLPFYRRRIKALMKKLTSEEPVEPLSLNQLEVEFQVYLSKK